MVRNFSQASVPIGAQSVFLRFVRQLAVVAIGIAARNSEAAQITLGNLAQSYDGSPKSVTVTTVPSGLNYTITYAGANTLPTNAGSYAVAVTIVDALEIGTANGTLVIAKASQTISMAPLTAKFYGDEPFTVSATSSGLPVSKWESTDPSVATISSDGLVTLLGAGQTSIIASNPGNINYHAAWVARPLIVGKSSASLPSGTQTVTYNGSAQGLDTSALPSGQATEVTYRDIQVAESSGPPQVVFQNGPDTLDPSYLSTGLQAAGYWGMAKYVSLGGTARKLDSCDVTLVTWAGYYGGKNNDPAYRYKEWADAHPELVVVPNPGVSIPGDSGGYYHPITLSFYEYENDGVIENYRILTSRTVNAFIPWRPSTLADGVTSYANSGYAFRVPFSFPYGVILPADVWVAVSFNTTSNGTAPVGSSGPYDALNIAKPSGQQVGSTLLASTLLYKDWRWQSSAGSSGPMLRLRAIPTNASPTLPTNAGTYEVKTQAAASGAEGRSTSLMVIGKAPVQVTLGNLSQIRDGSPKSVSVATNPPGIATSVSYAGSPIAPSDLGNHPIVATSANPNYEGQASDTLRIGDSFSSWQSARFATSGLPLKDWDDAADPDGDGLINFLEYAFNLDPVAVDHHAPGFELEADLLAFTYRRNLLAFDLNYDLEESSNLGNSAAWKEVVPFDETIVSDDGFTRVIRAAVPKSAGPSGFVRLKTSR
jgi:hypothetical protein